jgi:O-antigen/teichoic acid export membrane protein
MTLFVSIVLLFVLNDEKKSEMLGYTIITGIFYVAVIVVACYFICRSHPRSVWYTPVICNTLVIIMGITGAMDNPNFWRNSTTWLFFIGCILLSIIAAIIGARIGQKINNQAK